MSDGGSQFTSVGALEAWINANYVSPNNINYQQGSAPALPNCSGTTTTTTAAPGTTTPAPTTTTTTTTAAPASGWFATFCVDGVAVTEGGSEFTSIGAIQQLSLIHI